MNEIFIYSYQLTFYRSDAEVTVNDGFVKTFYQPYLVIAVKTGIQLFPHVMEPRLCEDDKLADFL